MNQLDLLTAPLARRTDPKTSHDAAAAARDMANKHHDLIIWILRKKGPLGKDGIAQWSVGHLTGTGVARRLPELERMGRVVPTGRTVTSNSGRQEREWRITWAPTP